MSTELKGQITNLKSRKKTKIKCHHCYSLYYQFNAKNQLEMLSEMYESDMLNRGAEIMTSRQTMTSDLSG